jgi:hypothetical protein
LDADVPTSTPISIAPAFATMCLRLQPNMRDQSAILARILLLAIRSNPLLRAKH